MSIITFKYKLLLYFNSCLFYYKQNVTNMDHNTELPIYFYLWGGHLFYIIKNAYDAGITLNLILIIAHKNHFEDVSQLMLSHIFISTVDLLKFQQNSNKTKYKIKCWFQLPTFMSPIHLHIL